MTNAEIAAALKAAIGDAVRVVDDAIPVGHASAEFRVPAFERVLDVALERRMPGARSGARVAPVED